MLKGVRVIAGKFGSRTLEAPAGMLTRPTSDRLRETLFNVLAPRIEGALFLDLYAGSGAVGIEAVSRGAASAEFVECAQPALKALRANLARFGMSAGVHSARVASWLKRSIQEKKNKKFDLIFLDPPYDLDAEYETTLGLLEALLAPQGMVIAEHRRKDKLETNYGALERTRLLEQGDSALSFFILKQS